jgi:signal transduction histidine kinase
MPGQEPHAYGHVMAPAGPVRLLFAVDAVVAAALATVWLTEVHADRPGTGAYEVVASVLAVGATVPLAFRRLYPRFVLAVLGGCFAAALLLGTAGTGAGVAFAAYSVLVGDRRRVGVVVVVAGYALIVLAALVLPSTTLSYFFLDAITFAMVIALAELVRTRRAYAKVYADRADQLERERVTLAEQAVNGERLRIARELHDVVAHAISLIAVQSSVALDRLRKDPDASARALATIETSSRAALAEMRRMLAVLRKHDEGLAPLAPSPGMADLPALAHHASAAGVAVRLVLDGRRPSVVPSGVDLCGYRIIQEALTNVVKHAPGASAEVSVRWRPDGLALAVSDDGHGTGLLGAAEGRSLSGHGLIGMRERVALFGGSFEAGPRTNGGFGVRIQLPFGIAPTSAGLAEALQRPSAA